MNKNESTYLLASITFLAIMAMVSSPIGVAIAADPKNGWGDATSEEAGEEKEGEELGQHAADPNEDGPGNDDRSGLGNTADTFTGEKNPDKLGGLLDCVDGDDEDDPEDPDDC